MKMQMKMSENQLVRECFGGEGLTGSFCRLTKGILYCRDKIAVHQTPPLTGGEKI